MRSVVAARFRRVTTKAIMVIASNAAPNQSHCCWALGSSSFICPSPLA
jgi:hypothetical protein